MTRTMPMFAPSTRPFGIRGVISISTRILRHRWAQLLGVALLIAGPGAMLTTVMLVHYETVYTDIARLGGGELFATDSTMEQLDSAFLWYDLAGFLESLLSVIAMVGFAAIVAADHGGGQMRLVEAVRICLRKSLHILALVLVIGATIFGLFVGAILTSDLGVAIVGIVIFYLLSRWAVALPIVAIEDTGFGAALRRSWQLTGRNVWRSLAILLIATLLTIVLTTLVTTAAGFGAVVIAEMVGFDRALLESIVAEWTYLLVLPLEGVMLSVFYYDLRLRRDDIGGRSS